MTASLLKESKMSFANHQVAIPLARQSIDESDIESVRLALKGQLITRGHQVLAFEEELASFCQVDHAVAFSSGSAALNAVCSALGIKKGDQLFVPANTFVATASCGYMLGADLYFVDIDPQAGLMNPHHLAQLLKWLPLGRSFLFPVHFAGQPVDLAPLKLAMGDRDFTIIEDSSHALGSLDRSAHPIGSCRQSSCCTFSFHPSKNITTGEGGAVTTPDPTMAKQLRAIRNSGIERQLLGNDQIPHPWLYFVQQVSSNHHLTDFAAALGRSQLKKVGDFQIKKERAIARYIQQLGEIEHLKIPSFYSNHQTHFHLFFVLIDFAAVGKSREDLMLFLQKEQISTGVHYIPLYHHPCWKRKNRFQLLNRQSSLKGCEEYYSKTLSLPLFSEISAQQIDLVCAALKKWLLGKTHL